MHGAIRFAAAGLLSIGLACASSVEVDVDQREDFAGLCTWDFLPLVTGSVHAPHSDARALDESLARLVEKGLLERGLARVAEKPDVFVTYFLDVGRQIVVVNETPAVEHLASMHDYHTSPSYDIQVTEKRVEVHETGKLTLLFSNPAEQRLVWRGTVEGRYRSEISGHLEDVVASLLERLPAPASEVASDRAARHRAQLTGECAARLERSGAAPSAQNSALSLPSAPPPRR